MKKINLLLVIVLLSSSSLLVRAQTFTNINASLTGLHYSDVAWGDYDADGDLDLIVAGLNSDENAVTVLYRNDGNDVFTEISTAVPGTYIGDVVWGDYDGDGDLDILIQGYLDGGNSQITKIFENKSDDTFVDSGIEFPALADGSVAFMDYNNDGFLDVLTDGFNGDGNAAFIYKNSTQAIIFK